MSFSNPITGGQGTLVRPAIKSPNYVPGASGWSIDRDGTAEFNDLTIRGTFLGTNFELNSSGLFFYAPSPGAGNLIGSWAQTSGTDEYGNSYAAGVTTYDQGNALFGQFSSGILQLGNIVGGVPDGLGSATIMVGGASLSLFSLPDAANGFPDRLAVALLSGADSVAAGNGEPKLSLLDGSGTSPASMELSGAVAKTTISGFVETWHTVGVGSASPYSANWSAATAVGTLTSMPPLRYKFGVEDNVRIQGSFTAAAGAGASVVNLPAAYRPMGANSQPLPCTMRSSTGTVTNGFVYVSMAGNLNMNANLGTSATAGTVYSVDGEYAIGNYA